MEDTGERAHGDAAGSTGPAAPDQPADFDAAQQAILVEIGQALMAQSTGGTVALDLTVRQGGSGTDVDLEFRLDLERQSGLTVPASAPEELVQAVQRLVLLWREQDREPWRVFTYRLERGESSPRYISAFEF
jgi:hypothetical protein